MGHLGLVTEREYLNKVKNKSFILATFLTPIIITLFIFLISYLTSINNDTIKVISVVDKTGYFTNSLDSSDDLKFEFINDFDLEEAKLVSKTKADYGLLYIPYYSDLDRIADSTMFISEDAPSITIISRIEGKLEKVLTNKNFENAGLDIDKINKSKIYINLYQESFEGEETTKMDGIVKMAFAFFLGMLLYIFIFAYGGMIMMSVIEEKTSRIVEVMISSVKPFQLMMGKILGTSLASLTQFLAWSILLVILSYVFTAIFGIESSVQNNEMLLSSSGNVSMNQEALDMVSAFLNLPLLNILVAFLLYFIGGYLLYASLFAAIGAAVDNQTDAQQFMMPITIILILALYVGMFTVPEDPNGTVALIFSYIPFTSPVVMMMRIPNGVPVYEQIISIIILYFTFVLCIWFAAKIYRVGILMYGKKPSIKELIKWLRY
ncbi:MAG: ABC transporter permease [Bacteroidota bacterium]|nr:ABC transporter permease [Bacteroidota bacterium]|tara:strand:+ start:502 stop:1806 length:1305 start_codon:yes stop_codon:yes gene_type:complete